VMLFCRAMCGAGCQCKQFEESYWIDVGQWQKAPVSGDESRTGKLYYFRGDGSVRIVSSVLNKAAKDRIFFDRSSNLLYWSGNSRCSGGSIAMTTSFMGRVPVSTNIPLTQAALVAMKPHGTLRMKTSGKECVLTGEGIELTRARMVPKSELQEFLGNWPPARITKP
jgi:hypothetical protein